MVPEFEYTFTHNDKKHVVRIQPDDSVLEYINQYLVFLDGKYLTRINYHKWGWSEPDGYDKKLTPEQRSAIGKKIVENMNK